MPSLRSSLAPLLLAGVASCSAAESPSAPVVLPPPTEAAPGPANALFHFQGRVDVARGTIDVTVQPPAGQASPQATLPYGTASGDVYFHTCGTPVWTAGTHTLTGSVQAVNRMTGTVTSLNAVIDSTVPSTVTPSSGTIATYGTVAANSADCSSTLTWTFTNPSSASYVFNGHATGYVDGLVAHWSLDEGSGTTFNDSSGNGQTATASGGSWQAGHSGMGYDGPAVTNAALPVTTTGVTISVWANRLGAGTGAPRIVSYDTTSINGLEIADYPSGSLGVWTGSAWNTIMAFPTGFTHIVVTTNSTQTLVYVGGVLKATLVGDTTNFTGFKMYLGVRGVSPGGEAFNGVYDDVRVYNRVLSASEVAAIP